MASGWWDVDLRSGESKTFTLNAGQRVWVNCAKLVHPMSAPTGQKVRVALRTKTGDVQRLELWAEWNYRSVPSPVMLDEDFWLEREEDACVDTVARFVVCDGNVIAIPVRHTAEYYQQQDRERQEAALADGYVREALRFEDDDEDEEWEYQEVVESTAITDDEEESHGASEVTGFMEVAAADAEDQEGGGQSQLLVLYRYTRFSAAWSDGGVEPYGSTKEYQLLLTAAAGYGARSLAWAGASLADRIYPRGSNKQLRELWMNLASKVSLPPGAARVMVFVEVGLLRQEDCTQASMGQMRAALKDMMTKQWPSRCSPLELNLPEPVWCGHDEHKAPQHDKEMDGEQRPAKRRRVVATEEDCVICYEPLKGDDLAAWPGCGKPHVLHGACMQSVLDTKPMCPVCRRDIQPTVYRYELRKC
ncbi:hypothetical protein QYE76_031761 [Lolium multiflorum]|uniref:RING-type domain-containing protein n=1 Tax=Lolium multiflorum TaxID=4521 RepID=A0AAD8VKQ7_LOLMU|nr:hypothetical protein QYE76_031761 [Lolium multiflorum]